MNPLARAAWMFAAAVLAQVGCDVAPASAQAVTVQTTPQGLAFRHVHMPDEPDQVLHFAWRDGTAAALAGKEAVATLGTLLLLEGPRGLSRSAMVEEFRDLHASAGIGASIETVQGQLSAPREKFAAAARLFARIFAEPALSATTLATIAKNRVVASQQADSNAETLAQRLLARLMLPDGPHRRIAMSDPTIYERVSVSDIDAWRRRILVRDGLLLVAAGPMDAAETGAAVDQLFGGLPTTGERPPLVKSPLRSPGKLVVLEKPVVQTAIAAAGLTGLAVTPEIVRAELAVAALGGGARGRLFAAVREELGAAYGISAALQSVDAATRALSIRSAVANDKVAAVLPAIREVYARFLAEGVTDEELEPLKRAQAASYRDRLRRASSLAGTLMPLLLQNFPDDYLATYEQRLRAHDRAAINADVAAKFPKPPLTMVVVAPSAASLRADCVIKAPAEIGRCE